MTGCSRSTRSGRLAILPFENLTGDASLDWIQSAAPRIVAHDIASGSAEAVGSLRDGYLQKPTRFVHGYFTRQGNTLRFSIAVEDAQSHKMIDTAELGGPVLGVMNAVTRRLDRSNAPVAPFSTSNEAAVEAWGRGEYERAVTLDPDFGAAWLAWVDKLSALGDASGAAETAARALARSSLRSGIDRARIELALATAKKDSAARTAALERLAELLPADLPVFGAAAQAEVLARRFEAAASNYQKILRADPENAEAMNFLGYAEGYAGNLGAARKALDQYRQQPGHEANALDSLGEVYFMNGRFAEAEKYFLQAHDKNSAQLGGVDLMKAAYARWLGGDLKGADDLTKGYLDFRVKLHDPLVAWRDANWHYTTGRRDQAIDRLKDSLDPKQPAEKQIAEKQIAEKQIEVWRGKVPMPSDPAAFKELYDRTPPDADSEVRVFYAAALVEAGRKDEARKLVTRWPLPDSGGDPLLQSLVFPKFLDLRRILGLHAN